MTNIDDMINSMKEDMKKYKVQYEELTKEIDRVAQEYSAKIDDLQRKRVKLADEGNAKIDELKLKREQVSGMHASLYAQVNKYVAEKQIENKPTQVVKSTKPKSNKKKSVADEEKTAELTKEDMEKLAEITANTTENSTGTTSVVDNKGNEVPDYLQEEYKK